MTQQPHNQHRNVLLQQYDRLFKSVKQMLSLHEDIDQRVSTYKQELDQQDWSIDPSCTDTWIIAQHDPDGVKFEYTMQFDDELRLSQSDSCALATTAFYHHWERSIKWLMARKAHPFLLKEILKVEFDKIKAALDFDELPDKYQKTMEDINLGRLIANVIKHGEGESAVKLRGLNKGLFKRPWNLDQNGEEIFGRYDGFLPSSHGINLIFVQPEHVNTVSSAIQTFWKTLPDRYFPPMRPASLESSHEYQAIGDHV